MVSLHLVLRLKIFAKTSNVPILYIDHHSISGVWSSFSEIIYFTNKDSLNQRLILNILTLSQQHELTGCKQSSLSWYEITDVRKIVFPDQCKWRDVGHFWVAMDHARYIKHIALAVVHLTSDSITKKILLIIYTCTPHARVRLRISTENHCG